MKTKITKALLANVVAVTLTGLISMQTYAIEVGSQPIVNATVEVIDLNTNQIKQLKSERESYHEMLDRIKQEHNRRMSEILNS